jgi:hypothetical protein
VLKEGVVEVLTTKVRVTSGGLDGEDTTGDGEKGDIERSSSEVEDENDLLLLRLLGGLTETVSDGSGGGLVDDTENIKTGDGSGVLGGETLGVVEVGGDGNDGLLDLLADLGLGGLLELGKNHRGDLGGGELLLLAKVVDLDVRRTVLVDDREGPVSHVLLDVLVVEAATDETLGVEDGLAGVHGGLVLGRVTDETLRLSEGNVGRGGPVTLVVGDDLDTVVLPDTDARVGGSEIDTDGALENIALNLVALNKLGDLVVRHAE